MSNQFFVSREACPACGSRIFEELYKRPYDEPPIREYLESFYSSRIEFEYLRDAYFVLCECKDCELIFQKEIPGDFLMNELYEKWINPTESFYQGQKSPLDVYLHYAQEIAYLIAYFRKVPGELIFFDFGMGWGKWALMAKGFGCECYGTELSQARIEHAKKQGIKLISWSEIPEHRFDLINTDQVFEHLPNPLDVLRYLKRALKPNGLIKISVPTANNIKRRLKIMDWTAPKESRISLNPVAPLEHINYFRRKSLIKMAEEAGMKETRIPMKIQYIYTNNWRGAKRAAKNFLLPIYRNFLKKQNYLFFKNM